MSGKVLCTLALLLLLGAFAPTVHAADHLELVVFDQRSDSKLLPRALAQALSRALAVEVSLGGTAKGAPAALGLLSVSVTAQDAVLTWTLPDGRGASLHTSPTGSPQALVYRITERAKRLAESFANVHAISEGELVDPYFTLLSRRGLPPPWGETEPRVRGARRTSGFGLDVINPFDKRKRPHRETIDPWI